MQEYVAVLDNNSWTKKFHYWSDYEKGTEENLQDLKKAMQSIKGFTTVKILSITKWTIENRW